MAVRPPARGVVPRGPGLVPSRRPTTTRRRRSPDGPVPRGRPQPRPPRAGRPDPGAVARPEGVPALGRPAGRGRAVRLLRGAADRQRPARRPPRRGQGLQGPVPPLQDHARLPGRPQGRLGLPRPAGRAGGREGAGAQGQAGDRDLRGGGVQRPLPRVGGALRRRLRAADRADRLLDRHQPGLPDDGHLVRGERLVGPGRAVPPRPAGRGLQGQPVLPPVPDDPVGRRGGHGLQGGRGPHRLCGPARDHRHPGRGGRGPAGLDDPALDAGPQRLGGGRPRDRLRAGRGDRLRRAGPQAGGGPRAGGGRGRRGRQGAAPGAPGGAARDPLPAGLRGDPRQRRGGGPGLDGGGRRLRHHQRRVGAGPDLAGLRRRGPGRRPALQHPGAAPGRAGRQVRPGDGLAGRPVRQGGRRRPGR